MTYTADEAIHDWIFENYARKVRLLKDDFKVIFNHEQEFDIGWQSGPCIIISLKYGPMDYTLFTRSLRRAFDYPYLINLKRSKALVKASDAAQLHNSTFKGIGVQVPKKRYKFKIQYVTCVKVVDIKTKASQTVEIVNSNAFDATNAALISLYGPSAGDGTDE